MDGGWGRIKQASMECQTSRSALYGDIIGFEVPEHVDLLVGSIYAGLGDDSDQMYGYPGFDEVSLVILYHRRV